MALKATGAWHLKSSNLFPGAYFGRLPVAFEPLWIVLEADITVTPVMTKADWEKGLKEWAKEK